MIVGLNLDIWSYSVAARTYKIYTIYAYSF